MLFWQPRRAASEAFGAAALVLVAAGSVVATLKPAGAVAPFTGSDLLGGSLAFGSIITALVYALGKVSGCHINPAVTVAPAGTARMPWRDVPECLGRPVAAALTHPAARVDMSSPATTTR